MDIEKELSELKPDEQTSFSENLDADLSIFEKSAKSKKDKKERKLKKREKDIFGFIDDDNDDNESLDFLINKKIKGKKEDIFDTSNKKAKNDNIDVKFRAEQAQLDVVLKDANKVFSDTKEIFNEIKASKSRGVGKVLTDLIAGMNSANTARLQVIREKSNIKKTIADLKMKLKALKKGENEDSSNEEFGARYLNELYGIGRNNAINAINEAQSNGYNSENIMVDLPLTIKENGEDIMIDSTDDVDDILSRRLSNDNTRSKEADLYIKYENLKPEICIAKSMYNDDINIMAIDKNGDLLPDEYPVPSIDDLGKLTFNYDSKTVADSKGRIYKLIIKEE